MSILHLMGPVFWDINIKTTMAPVKDFFEMLDSRPSQNNPPVAPTATDEDHMSISVGKKAA